MMMLELISVTAGRIAELDEFEGSMLIEVQLNMEWHGIEVRYSLHEVEITDYFTNGKP